MQGIYSAWLGVASIGGAGFAAYRLGWRRAGLALLALCAALGFDGLLHYALAPVSAHTAATNLTIGFEVAAAAALFLSVVNAAAKRLLGDFLDT